MKISVIIPCYRSCEYIEECITSVLMQKTNFNFEILIRDDFSNDGTDSIIEKYSSLHSSIRYFKAEENFGGHKNIKFLLEQSNAEYIAYLDGDDYWTSEEKLQMQADFLDSNPDFSMCFTGYWRQEGSDKSFINLDYWHGPNFYDREDFDSSSFLDGNPVNSLTRVFRNFRGIFKDYFHECCSNDLALNYELSKLGKIKYLNFPSGVYRIHGDSASSVAEKNMSREEFGMWLDKTRELMLKSI